MDIIIFLIILLNINIFSFFIYKLAKFYLDKWDRKITFERTEVTYSILKNAKEYAYNRIFREEIAVHNASGFSLDKDRIDMLQRKYVKDVLRMCGDEIVNDLIKIHGNKDALLILLINDFVLRVINDEIKLYKSDNVSGDRK